MVVNDAAKVRRMAEMTIDWMKAVREKAPAAYAKPTWRSLLRRGTAGTTASREVAPCVILACAPKDERTAPSAAMIAVHQIQLAAPGLGLGTTYTGSINTACQGYPPLVEMLGLPAGYVPHATCVIGYPAERYHRIPRESPST